MGSFDGFPPLELAFPGPKRDQAVAAILARDKTALTGLLQVLENAGELVPEVGQRSSVLDSAGHPAAVIELLGASATIGTPPWWSPSASA